MFILIMLLLLFFMPWHISFALSYKGITVFHIFIPWQKIKRQQEKITDKTDKKSRRKLLSARKGIRLKKLELNMGYQCALIDESMALYGIGLVIFPAMTGVFKELGIQTKIRLQYFPVIKSELKGMIEISLVKIMMETLRRQ